LERGVRVDILRTVRERRGLTQEAVATHAQITTKHLQRLERGTGRPGFATMVRLARALDMPVDAMLPGPAQEQFLADLPPLLTLRQAAARLGISVRTYVRRLVHDPSRVPPVSRHAPPGKRLFCLRAVERWAREQGGDALQTIGRRAKLIFFLMTLLDA
jgi:DNA-binding XRE family transcriptional regulator